MGKTYYCTVEATLDVIGGKWKPLIVYHLTDHTLHYGQLRKLIPNITQRMLTLHLRELESDGLILRIATINNPPKVQYSLTEYGKSLKQILSSMCVWGGNHIQKYDLTLDQSGVS